MMKFKTSLAAAVISGVLLCFSFPTVLFGWHAPQMGWLGWVALVPLLLAVRRAEPRRAFLLTFATGVVAYSGSLYWLYRALHTYGKMPPVTSVLVLVLLVLLLSAYLALAPLAARLIQTRWRGEFLALLPVCWTAVELLRNYMPCNGFPWANVAMSQWRMLPLIQIADLVGVYGVIFLLVWVNAFLAELLERARGERVPMLLPKAVVTLLLVGATLGYGFARLHALDAEAPEGGILRVGVVQGNIPQEIKWDERHAAENLDKMRRASRSLRDAAVDLILWPESAFPWPISSRATSIDPRVLGFDAREFGNMPYLLLGAVSENDDDSYYNSAVLFDAHGEIEGRYHKAHLVPFGEYVPYRRLLFFARKLTQPAGNFLAGEGYEPLSAGSAKLGPLVCYEDVFPEIARRLTRHGAELLINLTNDAWYGHSSAAYQHLAIATFRAVENRRYLVRATNTGVSAIVSPTGRVEMETGIFESAILVAPVILRQGQSLYTRLGDWFASACVAYGAIGLGVAFFRRIRQRGSAA